MDTHIIFPLPNVSLVRGITLGEDISSTYNYHGHQRDAMKHIERNLRNQLHPLIIRKFMEESKVPLGTQVCAFCKEWGIGDSRTSRNLKGVGKFLGPRITSPMGKGSDRLSLLL